MTTTRTRHVYDRIKGRPFFGAARTAPPVRFRPDAEWQS